MRGEKSRERAGRGEETPWEEQTEDKKGHRGPRKGRSRLKKPIEKLKIG